MLTRTQRRATVIMVTPFILPMAFFGTLWRESCRAWYHAYLEVRIELESAREMWHNPNWKPK